MTKKHRRQVEWEQEHKDDLVEKSREHIKSYTVSGDIKNDLYRYWVLAGLQQSKEHLKQDYDKKDERSGEYKRQLNYLRRQIFVHYVKNIFFFPIWLFKILTPSFFRGTPNIWTNLKIIATNKEFHPLRMAMISWLVFSYLIIQGGIFLFRYAPKTEAATYAWVQTGWVSSSTNNATHASNRTGWTEYWDVYPTNITTSTGTELTLATSASSTTDTTDLHFNLGTLSTLEVSESGSSASIALTDSLSYVDWATRLTGSFYSAGLAYGVTSTGNTVYMAVGGSGLQIIDVTTPATPTLTGSYNTSGNATDVIVLGSTAYVADGTSGLQIINLTTPATPTLTGTLNTLGAANGVAVSGNYAYIADDTNGLVVVDITTPATPTLTATYATTDGSDISLVGNTVYMTDTGSGLRIIDVSNPATPTLTGSYDTPGNALGVTVMGSYAYVADSGNGLHIIDLTTPATPTLSGTYAASGFAQDVFVYGNYAYVASYNNGMNIIDISNKTSPAFAGNYDSSGTGYGIHMANNYIYLADYGSGVQIIDASGSFTTPTLTSTFNTSGNALGVDVSGSYVYVADSGSGFHILDVTAPATPTLTGSYNTAGSAEDVAISGTTLYVADSTNGFGVYNVAVPATPTLLGSYATGSEARGVVVSGSTAYVAAYLNGLIILNVSVPSTPTLVGSFDTSNNAKDVAVSGNYVYVADSADGLHVIDISNPATPTLSGTYNTSGSAAAVVLSGNYAYVADGTSGIQVVNISAPTTPTFEGTYNTGGGGTGIAVSGNQAYLADGTKGLNIINVASPTAPNLASIYRTNANAFDAFVSGSYVYIADYGEGIRIIQLSAYGSSGTFTSRIMDTASSTVFDTMSWTASTPTNTTLTMKVRTGLRSDLSDATAWATCNAVTSGNDISSNNCVTDTHRYIQYQAAFATTDSTVSPTLSDVTINYTIYTTTEQTLTSSPFDTGDSANILSKIAWTENLPSGTDIKFQIRTSADGSTWTSWLGPNDGNDYYTAPAGTETINSSHRNGSSDRWIQYKVFISTTNYSSTPTLSDVTVTYVVNAAPEISGSGVTATQNANGTVTIVFGARDSDASTDTDGLASSTFKYSLNNGDTWTTIVSGLLQSGYSSATTTRALDNTNWATSTVTWTPKNEINGQAVSQAMIRVTVDDGELANNTVSADSVAFALDVKDPTLGSPTIKIIATTTPATIYNSVTDDNSLQMIHSLNSDVSGASWETYAATKTITIATDPDTVYAQFRDAYSNTSTIQSVTTPETPTNMVIRDLSNVNASAYKEFIAWSAVEAATPAFARYDVWRSTDGSSYTLLDTITSIATNYYLDQNLSSNTTYYYKISTVDANGSTSPFSAIVSDNADGQGGTDTTPPTISSVATSNVTTQGFTVTWNTDEISSSSIAYALSVDGVISGSFTTTTISTMADSSSGYIGAHSMTITGLTPNSTYYYYVVAGDPTGNRAFSSGSTQAVLDGPAITNVTVDSVDNSQAVITWITNNSSDSTVYYSTNSTMSGASNTTSDTLTTAHSITLTGLTQATTYYFYVTSGVATNNNGRNYYSFTTSNDSTGPVIASQASSNIGDDTALITWSTSEGGTSQVRYGTSSGSLGTYTTLVTNYNSNHSVLLSSLSATTTYYYTVSSVDASKNPTTSTELSFRTTETLVETPVDTVAPTITLGTPSPIADTTVVINWTTNEIANSRVSYGTTSGSLTSQTTLNSSLNASHAELVSGLTAATPYYYTVSSVDSSNNSSTSSESSFTTSQTLSEEDAVVAREAAAQAVGQAAGQAAGIITGAASSGGGGGFPYAPPSDTTPPNISNVRALDVKSDSATIAWESSEAGDTAVEFGKTQTYDSASVNFDTLSTAHSIVLFNLKPSTEYNYRVYTADKSGNRTKSQNQTFSTVSGVEEVASIQELDSDEAPESVFKALIEKTAEIIRKMSGQVSVDTLESGLATQYATISDLGKLVPLPLIGGQPVVEVGASYARIFWTTDKVSNSLVGIAPDSIYQTNKEYTQVVGNANEAVENHEVTISELKPSTTYHYQVRSKTPVSDTAKSRDFVFTTKEQQVEITTYKVNTISPESTSFSWATNVPTDSKVTYIPYAQDGTLRIDSARAVADKNVTTIHDVTVKDLEAGQIYQVELSGKGSDGSIVSKTISTFSTSEIDLPPVITQVQTDAALLPGDQTSVQAIISWITNEPTTSQIFYQKGFAVTDETVEFAKRTPLDPNYVKRHVIVITDFEPGSVYQFQVESVDSSGNTTRSRTFTLLSPRQKESVFQVIMSNLEETFSWVGQIGL